jgi:hypothetical protein
MRSPGDWLRPAGSSRANAHPGHRHPGGGWQRLKNGPGMVEGRWMSKIFADPMLKSIISWYHLDCKWWKGSRTHSSPTQKRSAQREIARQCQQIYPGGSSLARRAKRFFWSKVTSPKSICQGKEPRQGAVPQSVYKNNSQLQKVLQRLLTHADINDSMYSMTIELTVCSWQSVGI